MSKARDEGLNFESWDDTVADKTLQKLGGPSKGEQQVLQVRTEMKYMIQIAEKIEETETVFVCVCYRMIKGLITANREHQN